ncbi:MAG: type I pullulanase [Clostridiales bacterium]|nr:type I pullulanase [Clostridiales bacterium]
MKRTGTKRRADVFRCGVVALLIAAIAFLTAPFVSMRSHAESAERTETQEVEATQPEKTAQNSLARAAEPMAKFQLRIVYYRADGNYTGWNMWIWGAGAGGNYTEDSNSSSGIFTNEININGKDCMWLLIEIENAVPDSDGNIIGLIVRHSEGGTWWHKQSADMFLPADKVNPNGITVLYFIQDSDTIYYDADEALADRVMSATFEDNSGKTEVKFSTNTPIKSSFRFEVQDGSGTAHGSLNCFDVGKYNGTLSGVIPFTGSVDFGEEYTVVETSEDATLIPAVVMKHKLYDSADFINKYTYTEDLGVTYSANSSKFTVWTPVASDVKLNIYDSDTAANATQHQMTRGNHGEWTVTVNEPLNGKYYTYSATVNGTVKEVVDPYARSGGRNGKRGMILDLAATNPAGWENQNNPTLKSYSHAVIYEAHLRDLTIHESSNVSPAKRGKFLGMTEGGTPEKPTPLDYLTDLGVTAVHFQPLFDFASVDEYSGNATYQSEGYEGNGQFNWGYDPLNYNMPEGSYSSDPSNGATRVNEMKAMVMALHNAGIQVIMDVVYNHVSSAGNSNFEALMPGYYFRVNDSGSFYNGSGCGNETASERAMFRRFMIDSVKYWTEEYKIDGFRFDLMGLHDITTMNKLYEEVAKVNEDTMIYGEPWTGGTSGLPEEDAAIQKNIKKMPNIAAFNDIIRDGLKGSVFSSTDTGYVSGKALDAAPYVGAAGGTDALSEAYYKTLGSDKAYFAVNPTQSISYTACHDNSSLWDKLNASVEASDDVLKSMYRLAATSVLTSQGATFFLAGEELLRSKPTTQGNIYDNRATKYKTNPDYYFADNSYKSPDSVNAIDWTNATKNANMVEFYKGLIGIKKTFPMFQIDTTAKLKECLTINDTDTADGISMYAVKDPASNEYAVVIFNNSEKAKTVKVPKGNYKVYVKGDKATADKANPLSTVKGSSCTIGARSAIVMTAELSESSVSGWKYSVSAKAADDGESSGLALALGIAIPVAVLAVCGVVFCVLFLKKKGKKSE